MPNAHSRDASLQQPVSNSAANSPRDLSQRRTRESAASSAAVTPRELLASPALTPREGVLKTAATSATTASPSAVTTPREHRLGGHATSSATSTPRGDLLVAPPSAERVRRSSASSNSPQPRSQESARLRELKAAAAARAAEAEAAAHFLRVAAHGSGFWKHGRSGAPHERTVRMELHPASPSSGLGHAVDELRFDWHSDRMSVRRSECRLLLGKATDVLRRDTARRSKPELCFSIVGPSRTLDLEARHADLRTLWVEGLTRILQQTAVEAAAALGDSRVVQGDACVSGHSSSFLGVKSSHSPAPGSHRPTPPSSHR